MTLKSILHAGTRDDQPDYLRSKIKQTNDVAIILPSTVAIPFVFICWIYFPSLIIIPIMGVVVCSLVIWLNHMQVNTLSRILVSMFPVSLVAVFNANLINSGETFISSTYALQISFTLVPFLVFDWKEKSLLLGLSAFNLLLVLGADWLNGLFYSEIDESVLRAGWLFLVVSGMAVLLGLACVGNFAREARKKENAMNSLLEKSEEKNKTIQQSEKELQEYVDKVKGNQEEEKKRQWRADGLAKINEILRQDHENIQQTYDELVSALVKTLDATQCGLFEAGKNDDGETRLFLKACYAFDRKKYIEKAVMPGEGVLGQTYLEQQTTLLTEVPQSYTNIKSGLGGAQPNMLVIVPMIANDVVEGLIEIASFRKMEDHQVGFLEAAGRTIGASLRNFRINAQMKQYLNEAKKNEEVLRAQEEEMRQNHEELQATQDQLERELKENEEQSKEMEHMLKDVMAQLEQKERELEAFKAGQAKADTQ